MRSPELWKRNLWAIHVKTDRQRESSGASMCTDCKLWYSPMVRDRGGKERATDGRSLSNSALTFSSDNTLQQYNRARTRSRRRCEQRSASIMDGASVCALRGSALTRCHVATREAVSGASGLVCLFSHDFHTDCHAGSRARTRILEKEHSGCGWKGDIQKYKPNCPCFRVKRQTRVWETRTDERCRMRAFRGRMSKSERRRDAGRKRARGGECVSVRPLMRLPALFLFNNLSNQ